MTDDSNNSSSAAVRARVMPSPNLVASYIAFIIIGCFTFFYNKSVIHSSSLISWSMTIVLLSNATYYFCYEIYSESNKKMVDALVIGGWIEWSFRVIAQCVLFSLWFLLEFGWVWFELGLFTLYVIYIFWSILVWEQHPKKILPVIDLLGLTLSGFYVYASIINELDNRDFILGAIALGYLIISGAGIASFTNPRISE